MSRLHDRLRRASEDFVERLQEIIREELLVEFGAEQEKAVEPPHLPRPKPPKRGGARAETVDAQIVAFIDAHPGTMPKDIIAALKLDRKLVFASLGRAIAGGSIKKAGGGARVRYHSSNAEPPALPRIETSEPVDDLAEHVPAPPHEAPVRATEKNPTETLLDELDATLAAEMHPTRLFALLQAIVAEMRQAKSVAEPEGPLAGSLDAAIGRVAAFRAEKKLPYVVGLKRDVAADWAAMSRKWRARAASLDSVEPTL